MAITENIKGKAGGLQGEEFNQILISGLCFRNGDSSREDKTVLNQLYYNIFFLRRAYSSETSHFLHPLSTDSETGINSKTWRTNLVPLKSRFGKECKAPPPLPWLTGHAMPMQPSQLVLQSTSSFESKQKTSFVINMTKCSNKNGHMHIYRKD